MPFEIIRNDITNMSVDAIVNTANPRPRIGSGTDTAIHYKAGPELLEARKQIGYINMGEAFLTPGFRLPAKYVIHTVGPVWEDGFRGESQILKKCYANSLELAWEHGLESIAFPLIAAGNYGFPKDLALQIAVHTIVDFLEAHDMQIYLVVFNKDVYEISGKLFANVRSFIDENYVQEQFRAEYGFSIRSEYTQIRERFENLEKNRRQECAKAIPAEELRTGSETSEESVTVSDRFCQESLEAQLKKLDDGFSATLLKLIDKTGKKDAEIYKKANIDRKLFSKIRNNPKYQPTKATALSFAIALELDLPQTQDFIGRAGYALTRSSKFDVIITYFILQKIYDIHAINMMLFEFDQSLLGA